MKASYLIIPLITLAVALIGTALTNLGLAWYQTINLPAWTPSGRIIGLVWTAIFILTAWSALIFYNKAPNYRALILGAVVFLINAGLNILWSYLFFRQHLIYEAMFEAAGLGASVLILIVLVWPASKFAAILLLPYAGWTGFAAYLNYQIWLLNK
ncbi:MAG: hypothetical protein A3J65_03405 [Candidatus Buchananbacteria bacterium RIFCSPHIGHO2_02_FULL_45_11b]|uniref:TspO protein n=4 Tax=Candidatus Buchananiibacteriota TaxID=1817903 RepID=A0A1G1Y7W2_9BACT|nr:MAG: hypothetical protein A2663_01675 [Candidatus Buchananbacteria bacterium RIFCSPHIGHO2_01_FULL_46_12]OGY51862.1 MAG: hypothetical protein A3J65_03405 [Candidatus Buchananbacteria bacterium RIFCSPHIGHO2_02_FULL_45_11b]OGY54170.1 MAG: hypothetical protein A3B15_00080 [Candidatus Buchananbacteria bacterium RIFCSPLOWO2_01_FULL_45_31]OGY56082.1 MAG: hypothetical protein A3H67_04200 [Candidatus Buchananbacteria bacterium RIFCSPLOWO2_02_FULL_46_11b]